MPVSIEEVLVVIRIIMSISPRPIAEQRRRKPIERRPQRFKAQSADINRYAILAIAATANAVAVAVSVAESSAVTSLLLVQQSVDVSGDVVVVVRPMVVVFAIVFVAAFRWRHLVDVVVGYVESVVFRCFVVDGLLSELK